MPVTMRPCAGKTDFAAISDFLYSLYQPDNRDGNWFQPVWEYAYMHSMFDQKSIHRMGIWEDAGKMVALALYESYLGESFFQIHKDYGHLKLEMLIYAEQNLLGTDDQGNQYLKAYVNDFDTEFEQIICSRGYEAKPGSHRPVSQFATPDTFPTISLPDGFRLKSLAEDNNLVKIDRVLWRGFNHPGEPPPDSIKGREESQLAPNHRKDLTIVVEAPNGAFVSYAGHWFDPINKFGYVEPVATDPDYRRMGLGTVAVLESIRRCGELGATAAYVGSDMPFYLAMGFKKLYTANCWIKYFD